MPMKRLAVIRSAAFQRQQGRCFYCNCPMWQHSPDQFAADYRLTIRQAMSYQCTAEHLQARQDGGKDSAKNIAAACWFCNVRRHRFKSAPSPQEYRRAIQRRLAEGSLHRIQVSSGV